LETRKLKELKATNPYLRLGTNVSELEKSIQTLGLIAPLVISPDNVILAGARRYQAMLNLGMTEAPVVIVSGNELECELVSIDENLVRKDLSKIEIEAHLRRAKEIYQQLLSEDEEVVSVTEAESSESEIDLKKKKVVLPAEKFLTMVSEKTGLSPKQIHQAINRDELASSVVKEARKNGELSMSQTNEIVKLTKDDQSRAIEHLKELPVREIKKFVKLAQVHGVEKAIAATPAQENQKDFQEIEAGIKKLIKKMKQLQLEGIELEHYPDATQKLYTELMELSSKHQLSNRDASHEHSYQ